MARMGQVDPLDLFAARQVRQTMANPASSPMWKELNVSTPLASADILRRFLRARLGPGKLTFGEFVKFDLVESGNLEKPTERYVGIKAQRAMHAACNDPGWFALSKNKLLWQTYMMGVGFPVPNTLAAYDRKGRGGGVGILDTLDALGSFLGEQKNLPLFCKPTTGVYSIGTLMLDRLKENRIRVNYRDYHPVSDVVKFMSSVSQKGYLLQKPVVPHQAFDRFDGLALPTLRFLVFLTLEGPKIASVILKLGGPGEVADNYWRPGALMAAVQQETGQITRIAKQDRNHREDTDRELMAFEIPDYSAASELVQRASLYFPGVATQSWDVALSEKGPVLLELNHGGDLGLGQIAHNEGILSPLYCKHLRRHGYSGQLPA